MQEFKELARAVWKHSRLLITGSSLTAVLTLWTWISGKSVAKTTGLVVGIVLALWAFYLAWRDEHRARLKAERAVEEARQEPTLDIVFRGDIKPYLEEQPLFGFVESKDRRYRVGVTSNVRVKGARLLLEGCEPSDDVGVHLAHPFQVMGTGTEAFDINPGNVPSVFVDIVRQGVTGDMVSREFSLCYAASVSSAISTTRHVLALKVEGGGTLCRKSFIVDKRLEDSKLVMSELTEDVYFHPR